MQRRRRRGAVVGNQLGQNQQASCRQIRATLTAASDRLRARLWPLQAPTPISPLERKVRPAHARQRAWHHIAMSGRPWECTRPSLGARCASRDCAANRSDSPPLRAEAFVQVVDHMLLVVLFAESVLWLWTCMWQVVKI